MKLYVGNLSWNVNDNTLKELFASYGVEEAQVIVDRSTDRSKGFGFVTITDDEAGQKAISEMNGKEADGRAIKVSEAKPREDRD